MQAGRLDRRITIQRRQVTQSASGEEVETWVDMAGSRWASVAPVRGDERFSDPQLGAREQVEFQVRWSGEIADLAPPDRIVYPAGALDVVRSMRFDVLAVHEIGRRQGLRVIAVRRVDDPTELTRELQWGGDVLTWGDSRMIWL